MGLLVSLTIRHEKTAHSARLFLIFLERYSPKLNMSVIFVGAFEHFFYFILLKFVGPRLAVILIYGLTSKSAHTPWTNGPFRPCFQSFPNDYSQKINMSTKINKKETIISQRAREKQKYPFYLWKWKSHLWIWYDSHHILSAPNYTTNYNRVKSKERKVYLHSVALPLAFIWTFWLLLDGAVRFHDVKFSVVVFFCCCYS